MADKKDRFPLPHKLGVQLKDHQWMSLAARMSGHLEAYGDIIIDWKLPDHPAERVIEELSDCWIRIIEGFRPEIKEDRDTTMLTDEDRAEGTER